MGKPVTMTVSVEDMPKVRRRLKEQQAQIRRLRGLLRDCQGVISSHVNACDCPRCKMYDRIQEELDRPDEC